MKHLGIILSAPNELADCKLAFGGPPISRLQPVEVPDELGVLKPDLAVCGKPDVEEQTGHNLP